MIAIEARFHEISPILALSFMPESFQQFMLSDGFTEENLKTLAVISDKTDHDNITQNAEIHHAHSYKLAEVNLGDGKVLKWLDGDGMQRLKALSADAHDFHAEGRPDMVRYCLAKGTHYRVDVLTDPHLHRGKPWSLHHEAYEKHMASFLLAHVDQIKGIVPVPYKDVYKDARNASINVWYRGLQIVGYYEAGKTILDYPDMAMQVCKTAIQGICNWWITLAGEWGWCNAMAL